MQSQKPIAAPTRRTIAWTIVTAGPALEAVAWNLYSILAFPADVPRPDAIALAWIAVLVFPPVALVSLLGTGISLAIIGDKVSLTVTRVIISTLVTTSLATLFWVQFISTVRAGMPYELQTDGIAPTFAIAGASYLPFGLAFWLLRHRVDGGNRSAGALRLESAALAAVASGAVLYWIAIGASQHRLNWDWYALPIIAFLVAGAAGCSLGLCWHIFAQNREFHGMVSYVGAGGILGFLTWVILSDAVRPAAPELAAHPSVMTAIGAVGFAIFWLIRRPDRDPPNPPTSQP